MRFSQKYAASVVEVEDSSRLVVAVSKTLSSLSCVIFDLRRLLDDVDSSTTMVVDEHRIADRASKSIKVNLCIFIIKQTTYYFRVAVL